MEVARERGFCFLFFFFLSGEWERACFLMDVLSVRRKN